MKLGPIEELMARLCMGVQSHHLTKLRFSCSDLSESQKQNVRSPICLLTVLRKKSTSNEQFLAKLERLFEGVDDFEEFAKIVEEFRGLHPNPNSIPPPSRPAFSNGALSYQPSRDQKVKFRKMLVKVSDSMSWIHVELMLALSPVPDNLKEYVKVGFELFEELQRHGCISENDTELLDQFFSILNLKTPATLLRAYQNRFPPQLFDDPPPSAPIYRSHSQPSSSFGSTPTPSGSYHLPRGSTYGRLSSYPPPTGSHPSLSLHSLPSGYGGHSTLGYQSGPSMSSPPLSRVPLSGRTPPGQSPSGFPDPGFTPPMKRPIQDSSPPPSDPVTHPSLGSQVGRKRPASETHGGDPLERPPPPKSIHTGNTAGHRVATGTEELCSVFNSNASSYAPGSERFPMPITRENTGNKCLEPGMERFMPGPQADIQRPAGGLGPFQESSVQQSSHPASPSKMALPIRSTLHPPMPHAKQVYRKENFDEPPLSINLAASEASFGPGHPARPYQPTTLNAPRQAYLSPVPEETGRPEEYSLAMAGRPLPTHLVQPSYHSRLNSYGGSSLESQEFSSYGSRMPDTRNLLSGLSSVGGSMEPRTLASSQSIEHHGRTRVLQPRYDDRLSSYGGGSLESQGFSSYSSQTLDTRNLLSGLSSVGGSMEPGTLASSQSIEHHGRTRGEGERDPDWSSEKVEPRGGVAKLGLDTSEYPGVAEEDREQEEERSSSLVGRFVSGVTGFLGSLTSLGRGSGNREIEKTGEDEEEHSDEYESCPED